MARPIKELTEKDWQQLEKLCALHCTGEECAGVLGMDYDTLNKRIKETHGVGFSDYFTQKSSHGKASLRRRQFEMAQKNAAMAIWLGKQWLGQSEKIETKSEITGSKLVIDLGCNDIQEK
jgi:hypothetical protein